MSTFDIDDTDLINCVKQFPSIYDKNHGDYRNKHSKLNAWKCVGEILGVSEEVCEQRWSVLRNRYATELRNKKKIPNGKPSPSAWRLSQAMSFLEEYISPRRSRGALLVNKDKKILTSQHIKTEIKPQLHHSPSSTVTHVTPETLVAVELRSASPTPTNNCNTTRLRPIAPRPVVQPAVTRLVSVKTPNEINKEVVSNESEDEDILFGKSIGHSLKNIKSKKIKLQIKSEILAILAKHSD